MATRATVERYNRHMKTFEYMQHKLLKEIDRRSKRKEADENVMEKHLVATGTDGARTYRF